MKIDLDKVDRTQFMVHEHSLNGEIVHLIQPQHIGTKWTQDNKHMRSVVVNYEGEVISAGFPKFTNWGENPDHFPVPTSLRNCTVMEKLDGSLLIVSKYKGQYILRTRGTVDASTMANGHELELFKEKFLKSLTHDTPDTWNVSILFEWVSPINKIVLNYGDEPDWYVVGLVHHSDYSLYSQEDLDMWAKNKGFKRPATYTFNDINDLSMLVKSWEKLEGVVVYSKNDQVLHKLKSDWYLIRHRLKDEFSSLEKVLDFYLDSGYPDFHTFQSKIAEVVDWETAKQIVGDISRIVDAKKEVDKIVDGMNSFVNNRLRSLSTRKEQAQLVISSYGDSGRSSMIFKILDGKSLDKNDYKKLIFQILKN